MTDLEYSLLSLSESGAIAAVGDARVRKLMCADLETRNYSAKIPSGTADLFFQSVPA